MTFADLKALIVSRIKENELCDKYADLLDAADYDALIDAAVDDDGPFFEWVYQSGVFDDSLFVEIPEATLNAHGIYINNVTLTNPCTCTDTGGTVYSVENGLHPKSDDDSTSTDVFHLGGSLVENTSIDGGGSYYTRFSNTRLETDKGTDTAAANDLTLPNDGNLFTITGNTQINAIATANWQAGSEIGFIFTGTPTLKNNTAGGAGTAPMLLSARTDYTAAAGDYLALRFDGTNWYETQRKAAGSGPISANNGLTMSTPRNAQLGGTLVQNTTIATTASYKITFSGNEPTNTNGIVNISQTAATGNGLYVTANSTSGAGIFSSATNGIGVSGSGATGLFGSATSGTGVWGNASSGTGGLFQVTSGTNALRAAATPSATNTISSIISIEKGTSGTAANNIGASIDYFIQNSDGTKRLANQVISKWTDVTTATRTSEFSIKGVSAGTTQTVMQISGAGTFTLTQGLSDYADDTAAAAGGIPVNGLYRTGSIVKIRVS